MTTTRTVRLSRPLHLAHTLGHLQVGGNDPTMRMAGNALARASRTPDGPVTLRVDVDATGRSVTAVAAGPGSDWALHHVPDLLGCNDRHDGFEPGHDEVVARLMRRVPGFRIGHTGLVADLLAATILAQKVTATEAIRAWHHLVEAADQPAPRAPDLPHLLLPPTADWWANTPSWRYTAAGVDRSRAMTIIGAHRHVTALQAAGAMPRDQRRRRLTAIRGIGPWTAAIIERAAFGDPDAVEVGDFHLANIVAWNLASESRADDDRMLELLAPFTGHRGRVAQVVKLTGRRPPAYGPRLSPRRFGARTRSPKGR